jgi:hypothetical protein
MKRVDFNKFKIQLLNKIRVDTNKNPKLPYYLRNVIKLLIPEVLYQKKLLSVLKDIPVSEMEYIESRVNYYNKLTNRFSLNQNAIDIKSFKKNEKKKTYYFDLLEYLRYFPLNYKFNYLFGDIIHIPPYPAFVKSRPIEGGNQNSVLMKLNKIRHFIFVNDKLSFNEKKDMAVFRGQCFKSKRIKFVQDYYNHPLCNVGQTNIDPKNPDAPWIKHRLSIANQLQYKFIVSIEGNDVASNLKWIMSSNSLVIMPKPKYETWFMEGTLIPNYHYILIKDDYSDFEEKINYYLKHQDEAIQIIRNANRFVEQFKNPWREDIISLLVLKKYFELSGQTNI